MKLLDGHSDLLSDVRVPDALKTALENIRNNRSRNRRPMIGIKVNNNKKRLLWNLVVSTVVGLSLFGCSLAPSETTSVTTLTDSKNSTIGSLSSATTKHPETTNLDPNPTTSSLNPTSPSKNHPTTSSGDAVEQILEKLSLEEKIKQMLVVHFDESMVEQADAGKYGGYLFFASFFKDRQPVDVSLIIEKISERSNTPYPVLFAVDEEGGTVNRISQFTQYRTQKFQSPQKIVKESGVDGLILDTRDKSRFLKKLGINLNLAPVADVSTDSNSFIYSRTLGLSIDETSFAIGAMVRTMKEENMISSIKHFPGYGDNVDTHEEVAVDGSSLEALADRLKPFQAGIDAGAPTLMVSHIIMKAFDEKLPASLSTKAHAYIRTQLGFSGVIITDDLQMKGLTKITERPFVAAVLAGNDLLITNDPDTAVESIANAVKDGTIAERQINEAVRRVLKLKASLNQS